MCLFLTQVHWKSGSPLRCSVGCLCCCVPVPLQWHLMGLSLLLCACTPYSEWYHFFFYDIGGTQQEKECMAVNSQNSWEENVIPELGEHRCIAVRHDSIIHLSLTVLRAEDLGEMYFCYVLLCLGTSVYWPRSTICVVHWSTVVLPWVDVWDMVLLRHPLWSCRVDEVLCTDAAALCDAEAWVIHSQCLFISHLIKWCLPSYELGNCKWKD